MDDAEHSLLDAADSYRPGSERENRLTEIFASVLRAAPRLVGWLSEQAFGVNAEAAQDWASSGYSVRTQRGLSSGRPDMEIEFHDPARPPTRLFFCENKIDAPPTPLQTAGYCGIESRIPILFISPTGERPNPRFVSIGWQQLADEVDQLGRRWAAEFNAGNWRSSSMRPEAPSQYRMLAELLRYLERQNVGVKVAGPLTEHDLRVVPHLREVRERWDLLFEYACEELYKLGFEGEPARWQIDKGGRTRDWTGWELWAWVEDKPVLDRLSANPETVWRGLILAPENWVTAEQDQPTIGAGVSVWLEADWPEGLRPGEPLRLAVEDAGFRVTGTWQGQIGRVFDTRALSDVVSEEEKSLRGQAERIARWADDRLMTIHQLLLARSTE